MNRVKYLLILSAGMTLFAACAAPTPAPQPAAAKPATQTVVEAAKPAPTSAPAAAAPIPTAAPKPTDVPKLTEAPKPAAPAPITAPAAPANAQVVQTALAKIETPSSGGAGATGAMSGGAIPAATTSPIRPNPTTTPQLPLPATQAVIEPRVVEVEYPPQMRLGDSEMVRLSLIPSANGYTLTLESPNTDAITKPINIKRPLNAEVSAEAKLTGVGFEIAEHNPNALPLPDDEAVTWRWTVNPREAGQHKLTLSVDVMWTPAGATAPNKRSQLYSRGLDITVTNAQSMFGLSMAQASTATTAGIILGSGLIGVAFLKSRRKIKNSEALPNSPFSILNSKFNHVLPNTALIIEKSAAIELSPPETALIQAVFCDYARVMIEREFRSGYSGARTLLTLPIRNDGRADAYTIAKMGAAGAIAHEYQNFERYVKHTLPPITARIQEAPIQNLEWKMENGKLDAKSKTQNLKSKLSDWAVLRYTFIGEPGKMPLSLGDALRANGDAALLHKLFDTFGPNWWLQRKPYSFRLAQEYDRVLPSHIVVAPAATSDSPTQIIDGQTTAAGAAIAIGTCVLLRNFSQVEAGISDNRFSLIGAATAGQAPLRVRCADWVDTAHPPDAACTARGLVARVVGSRESLLRESVTGLSLFGLPDPIPHLPRLLNEHISGTQSTIHGDLNLENALVGPGGFIWLIDFATTRDGHTLFDFAHLHAEIIAHVIAPQMTSFDADHAYAKSRDGREGDKDGLLASIRTLGQRCLFNPTQPREYDLALFVSCLGALKHRNLDAHQRHWLYLTAAQIGQRL